MANNMSISNNGIAKVISEHSFVETFEKLKTIVLSREFTIFATINFCEDAERAGLKMNPAKLLIF